MSKNPLCTCENCGRVYTYSRKAKHTLKKCNSCCNTRQSKEFRDQLMHRMINIMGGKCERCGYNKHPDALEFHHVDPATKLFGLSTAFSKSWDKVVAELNKCELVCSNCHREIESASIWTPFKPWAVVPLPNPRFSAPITPQRRLVKDTATDPHTHTVCTCKYCGKKYDHDRKKGHSWTACHVCYANKNRYDRKAKMIELKGGKCSCCGYDRCYEALDFHHRNPETKMFRKFASHHGIAWSRILEELEKCDIMCSNCHRECKNHRSDRPLQ